MKISTRGADHPTTTHWVHKSFSLMVATVFLLCLNIPLPGLAAVVAQSPANQAVSTPASPTVAPTPTPILSYDYTAHNGQIFQDGQLITLHGVNWFGFDTPEHIVHGLWARNLDDQLSQIKSSGFNAIRLPFCPAILYQAPVSSVDYKLNPSLKGLDSTAALDLVLQKANQHQLYIVLDHHSSSCSQESPLWYSDTYTQHQWITNLQLVASRYQALPYFLGLDLENEPHDATWGTGDVQTDWNTAAELAGQAVHQTNPHLLIFVQGIYSTPSCSTKEDHFWGENLEAVRCYPIRSEAIPANKLILSPHVFGPDTAPQLSYFQSYNFPANMPAVWNRHFGSLTQTGATLVVGEWGGRLGLDNGDPRDKALEEQLVPYLISKHICNSFYWSWGPNSHDTGGYLQADWQTPWPAKQDLIHQYFNQCS